MEMFDEEENCINELFGAVKTSVRPAIVSTQVSPNIFFSINFNICCDLLVLTDVMVEINAYTFY